MEFLDLTLSILPYFQIITKQFRGKHVFSPSLCFQTTTNSHQQSCLKMSHTQDMVMITTAISLEIFEGEILAFVKQNNLKF